MPSYSLVDYASQALSLGRAAVFYANYWDGSTDLALTHVGVTEQPITPPTEEAFSRLTLGELTGEAALEAYVMGPNGQPVFNFNVVDASAAAAALFSSTNTGSAGYRRRRAVTKHTLVLFPEQLFIESNAEVALAYTNTDGWFVGGDAATVAQLTLIDLSMWYWRGFFYRALPTFTNEDGSKATYQVSFEIMHDLTKPDGQQLWTRGDPADAGIDISPSDY